MSKKARRRPSWKKWAQKYYRNWDWNDKHWMKRIPNNRLRGYEGYQESVINQKFMELTEKLEWE